MINIKDIRFEKNVNLSRFTTIRINVTGDIAIVSSKEALKNLLLHLKKIKVNYHMIGHGANQVLLNTEAKLFIKLDFPIGEEEINLKEIYLPASISLNRMTKMAKKYNLGGWEIFTGIPASLGGAIAMNAGTRLGEIKEIIKAVEVIDQAGDIFWLAKDELAFEYRGNKFLKTGDIIIGAKLIYKEIDPNIGMKIDDYLKYRMQTQPLNTKNCGCVFKNPSPDMPAGKIIDELGLKGLKYKSLTISELHGNFIENSGDASAEDFLTFVNEIKERVKRERGIEFEFEVKLI